MNSLIFNVTTCRRSEWIQWKRINRNQNEWMWTVKVNSLSSIFKIRSKFPSLQSSSRSKQRLYPLPHPIHIHAVLQSPNPFSRDAFSLQPFTWVILLLKLTIHQPHNHFYKQIYFIAPRNTFPIATSAIHIYYSYYSRIATSLEIQHSRNLQSSPPN